MIQEPDEYNMEVNPPNRLGLARVAVDSSAFFEKNGRLVFAEGIDGLKAPLAEACLNAVDHGNRTRPPGYS